MHFDPDISQISREVKFWCVILIFLSSFTLFNIFTFVTTNGMCQQYVCMYSMYVHVLYHPLDYAILSNNWCLPPFFLPLFVLGLYYCTQESLGTVGCSPSSHSSILWVCVLCHLIAIAYIHTTYIHTCIHKYIHTYMHAYMYTLRHLYEYISY
jgi:hypothetical protein